MCTLPNFTDSFFNISDDPDLEESQSGLPSLDLSSGSIVNNPDGTGDVTDGDPFQELSDTRGIYPKNVIMSYLNINSLRYKFSELSDILRQTLVVILIVGETKLNDIFNQSLFDVSGYRSYRKDRTGKGGGLLFYINSNIPSRRREDLELSLVESIVVEVTVNDRKWAVVGIYSPPSNNKNAVYDDLCSNLDKISIHYDHIMVVGDLNVDMKDETENILTKCDVFDFKNLIRTPTCFMKNCTPSLVDVILCNSNTLLFNTFCFNCGLSDWHNMICTVFKGKLTQVPKEKKRCAGGPKSKDFWPTIKPFLSNKGKSGHNNIILKENDDIVSDQTDVSNIFNEFYVNVASDIGNDENGNDEFVLANIREHTKSDVNNQFHFKPATPVSIEKCIKSISLKKATGIDGVSPRLLRACCEQVKFPLCNLFNHCIRENSFPDRLKEAQVVPVFKKKDPLNKENYRPVTAFRPGFGCQSTLMRIVEDWRKALDNHEYVAAIPMDLSKAFGCLPHDLLIRKLEAYGLGDGALKLLSSYLTSRSQQDRKADIKRANTVKYGHKSFSFEAARVWNSLPNEFRRVENFSEFKRLIHTWDDQICQCAICLSFAE
ncbi:uncharacterized protein [Argopecten irradians]|uniref:uncharacterized protein n=1 Tax=Argopecten irradians TaxID=31199 RepID=UPI003714FCCF